MEWLDKNCDALLVTIIGGIFVALFTKYFLSNKSEKTSKRDSSKKLTNEFAYQTTPVKDDRLRISDLTLDEKKLYSELVQFTNLLVKRITILAPLRHPQLEVEYKKFKLFLFNGVKDFDLKLEQSLEVSKSFKSNTKSFLGKIDANCYKLASFMDKDIGMQNANILEIAKNLKDEIQEFQRVLQK